MKAINPYIAASRAAAPGPAVSGYNFLSTLLGSSLAARIPGTLTAAGVRPHSNIHGTVLDALALSPWGRGVRAPYRVIKALRARQSLPEIIEAARVRRPFFGPGYRALLRTDVRLNPNDRALFADPNDPNRIRFNPISVFMQLKKDTDAAYARKREEAQRKRRTR